MKHVRPFLALAAVLVLSTGLARAGELNIPHSFNPNTPAVAAQVNANFDAVETAVNDNDARIIALETALGTLLDTVATQASTITSLQDDLAALQGNSVLALDDILELVTDPATGQPTARFSAVNVQVVNGTGTTSTTTGVGNLIVGYNEWGGNLPFCSNGDYSDETSCTGAGGIWAVNQRSGSHNLVLGNANAYSRYGGLLAGTFNMINGEYASVSGASENTASGFSASVSGGVRNTASGYSASVSGGVENTASGYSASVSGGYRNIASGWSASVGGGYGNIASGWSASVGGGHGNIASGWSASVSGGSGNTASGDRASVSGGGYNTAIGDYSSVSGGYNRSATGNYDWRAGTLFEDQ